MKLFTSDWDFNPPVGTQTQPKPSLGVEPMGLGLKPSQNPWYLVSGANEAQILDVSSQKEFSERQSDRWEIDLFRFREKHNPQTVCGPSQRASTVLKLGMRGFYRLSNFICWWVGGSFQLLWGRGRDFQDLGHCPLLGPLPMPCNCGDPSECHFTCWLRIKVWSCLPSWSHFILIVSCCVLGLYVTLSKIVRCPVPSCYRYMCVWAYYICDFCIALRKCRSSCEKTTGVDCDILSSSCPSVWFKSFPNENKAELEVITHCPRALVSRPPLVIWKMQKHPFVLLRLIITDILNLQFWNKLSLMHLNSLILFYLRVKMFMITWFTSTSDTWKTCLW